MQLCVPLRIVFCGGAAEVDAIGVDIIVAERSCGEVNILGHRFKLDVTGQFSSVQFTELLMSFGNGCLT